MFFSLLAILMLLSDETIEDNEVDWFFQNGGYKGNHDKFETQFLGWKMGSASGKSGKNKKQNKTPDSIEGTQNEQTDISYRDQSFKTSPTWRTLILADSTIHYIPLEEMATVRAPVKPFIPDDVLDPFYLDTQPDILNNELVNNQFSYKVPTPQNQIVQKADVLPKNNSIYSILLYPIGLGFKKKTVPLLDPFRGGPQNPMTYHGKPKIEPRFLPEMGRHTMFVHPRLMGMMKAMDHSILSFPSKFEYKSLEQLPMEPRHLLPNRYNGRFVV